jgi:hypothetical protein
MSQPEHFDVLVLGSGQGGQLIGVRGNGSRQASFPTVITRMALAGCRTTWSRVSFARVVMIAIPEASPRERYNIHGRAPNLSRLQVEAAATSPEKPLAARTVCDDGLPGSFSGTYAANPA